jgi:hypothetical protein
MGMAHQQRAAHNDQNSASLITWLCVERRDLVLNLGEWKGLQFLDNLCGSLARSSLECEHRVILLRDASVLRMYEGAGGQEPYVERAELGAVAIKSLVVKLDELLC